MKHLAIFILTISKQLNLVPRSSRLTVNHLQLCYTFDVIGLIWQNSIKFGQQ